jgi:hypothetical protein
MRLTIKQKQQKLRIYKFRKLAQRRKKLFMCLLNFTKRTVDRTIMSHETDIVSLIFAAFALSSVSLICCFSHAFISEQKND